MHAFKITLGSHERYFLFQTVILFHHVWSRNKIYHEILLSNCKCICYNANSPILCNIESMHWTFPINAEHIKRKQTRNNIILIGFFLHIVTKQHEACTSVSDLHLSFRRVRCGSSCGVKSTKGLFPYLFLNKECRVRNSPNKNMQNISVDTWSG